MKWSIDALWEKDGFFMDVMDHTEVSLVFPYSAGCADLPSLNIGCGTRPVEGWINTDIIAGEDVDYVFNSEGKWPFEDNSMRTIYCSHVIEHLDNLLGFFEEAKRVIHPEGSLLIRVPHPRHSLNMAEPDHKRMISENFFYYLQTDGIDHFNLQITERKSSWKAKIMIHAYSHESILCKWYVPKKVKFLFAEHIWNTMQELFVWLKPIKT